ncbi:MAG TPA: sugar ABC transporter ATP-binding protein, partial [Arthrobacter bacterium]|nr:sugar ABC transporter ATP-binding protein [Arthrobacter sp.]
FSILFITHDISLMVELSHRMAVMYAGKLVEVAPSKDMLENPLHPYTHALMGAFPPLTGPRVELTGIPDAPPNMAHPPTGCRFHPRCPFTRDDCVQGDFPLRSLGVARATACIHDDVCAEDARQNPVIVDA